MSRRCGVIRPVRLLTAWPPTQRLRTARRLTAATRLPTGTARRLTAAALAGLGIATLIAAAPAWAHGADAPDGTDYRTEVTRLSPALPGLTVRVVEAGARLELVNHTGRPIEVLGYDGEPYLEVRPDGVYENRNSPATYLNQTLSGTTPPATADPRRPPAWRRVSTEPVARWHDRRSYWQAPTPPAVVAAEPGRAHRVRDWTVPLRDGVDTIEVQGTLDWVPPPNPLPWWGLSLLGAAAIALLGARAGRRALAVVLAVGGTGAVALATARAVDTDATGAAGTLAALLSAQLWPMLTGLAALAIAGYGLARRPSGDFALTLAGVCLALFAGVTNAEVFARSVIPVPGPALWARLTVALLIAAGAGVAVAGILRLRAAARLAPMAADSAAAGTPAR